MRRLLLALPFALLPLAAQAADEHNHDHDHEHGSLDATRRCWPPDAGGRQGAETELKARR